MAIGFLNSTFKVVSVDISNSTFFNNTVFSPSHNISLDVALFPGRGGAIGIFLSSSFDNVSVVITECVFRENVASLFGGAIFHIMTMESLHYNFLVQGSRFYSNLAYSGASGMGLVNSIRESNLDTDRPVLFRITGCYFSNHTTTSGGSLAIFPSYLAGAGSQMIVSNSTFVNNKENELTPFTYGSAIAISDIRFFVDRSSTLKHQISNW